MKETLDQLCVYNFDVIISENGREIIYNTPLNEEGNKEYYDSILGIALHTRRLLIELYNKGMQAFADYNQSYPNTNSLRAENPQRIKVVYDKLVEISILLGYTDPKSLEPGCSYKYDHVNFESSSSLSGFQILERPFANEITLLYFVNLNQEVYFPILFPQDSNFLNLVLPAMSDRIDRRRKFISPRDRLQKMMNHDDEIKDRLSMWLADCLKFHKQTENKMRTFFAMTSKASSIGDS